MQTSKREESPGPADHHRELSDDKVFVSKPNISFTKHTQPRITSLLNFPQDVPAANTYW